MAETSDDRAPAPTRELGSANPSAAGGSFWTDELEQTPELQWPRSISVYERMRTQDSQVRSVLQAVALPIRRANWRIDQGPARPEVAAHVANDLGLPLAGQPDQPMRRRDRFSWSQHLQMALLDLAFGHMFFEQVYRIDDATGLAHLRKLGPRMPSTLTAINVAADGGLSSIEQAAPAQARGSRAKRAAQGTATINVDRLVGYVHEREGGNWLGHSLLRSSYKNWLIKDRLLRVQAQTVERNGMGIPLYTGPERPQPDDIEKGLAIAKGWRSGESAGAAVPYGANVYLRGVDGQLPDADKPIRYHDEQIARGVLAHFLNLGTQTGSWALGSSFLDFFTMSLQAEAEAKRDVTQDHVIEDLVDVNWGPDEPAPLLVFDEIGSRHDATAQAVEMLLRSGALSADPALEAHLRGVYGLPMRDNDTAPPPGPPSAPTGEPVPAA